MKKPLIAALVVSALALSAGGAYVWVAGPHDLKVRSLASTDPWCATHDRPGDECTECDPTLVAGFKERNDWCAGHGLPESHCEPCNPGILNARRAAATATANGAPPAAAWCATHDRPGDECTECDPTLVAGFKERNDWCAGHGLPESHCEPCNPGILTARRAAATAADGATAPWCEAHDRPGDECTECHPELVAGFKQRNDWCAGHGLPESHCEPCNPGVLRARRADARARAPGARGVADDPRSGVTSGQDIPCQGTAQSAYAWGTKLRYTPLHPAMRKPELAAVRSKSNTTGRNMD